MLKDIRDIIFKPAETFDRIKEKGLILPSFFIYLVAETFWIISHCLCPKGIEAKTEIITEIPSLVALPFVFFLWTGVIQLISRQYGPNGSYRNLLSVWGYTYIPRFFFLFIFFLFYLDPNLERPILFIPAIFVFLILFIWIITLIIIAIRVVYKFTLKRVLMVLCIFLIAGSLLESIFVSFKETCFFQSYLYSKIPGGEEFMAFTKDKVSYYFRAPKEGEFVIFVRKEDAKKRPFSVSFSLVGGGAPLYSWIIGKSSEYIGRIKEIRGENFLVLPDKEEAVKEPYGLLEKKQIRGRVCDTARYYKEDTIE